MVMVESTLKLKNDEDKSKLKDNIDKLKMAKDNFNRTLTIIQEQEQDDALYYSEWTKIKSGLKYNKEIDANMFILNNCIYWAFLGCNIGSEQNLHRPVLVVQTSKNSPICSIIPLTLERLNDGYWYHIDLDNGISTALVEHLRVIDKRRIDKPLRIKGSIETITKDDWKKINEQLKRLYVLKPLR